jgi:hypothetical protein
MCNLENCVCAPTPAPAHPAATALVFLPLLLLFGYAGSLVFMDYVFRKSGAVSGKGIVFPHGGLIQGTVANGLPIPGYQWTIDNCVAGLAYMVIQIGALAAISVALASAIVYPTGVVYALVNGVPLSENYWSELTHRMTSLWPGIVLAIHFALQAYH